MTIFYKSCAENIYYMYYVSRLLIYVDNILSFGFLSLRDIPTLIFLCKVSSSADISTGYRGNTWSM